MIDQSTPTVAKQRVVHVLISSTFRDMQEERDVLVKKVFPELRRRCRERGVEFVGVSGNYATMEWRDLSCALRCLEVAEAP